MPAAGGTEAGGRADPEAAAAADEGGSSPLLTTTLRTTTTTMTTTRRRPGEAAALPDSFFEKKIRIFVFFHAGDISTRMQKKRDFRIPLGVCGPPTRTRKSHLTAQKNRDPSCVCPPSSPHRTSELLAARVDDGEVSLVAASKLGSGDRRAWWLQRGSARRWQSSVAAAGLRLIWLR